MMEWLEYLQLQRPFAQSWMTHLIDIVLVFIIIYEILKLVRDTRAVQMATGIAVVAVLYVVSKVLHLDTLQFLMRTAMFYVGFGIIVLFQSEIRAALTHFGKNLGNSFLFRQKREKKPLDTFDEIILATTTFSAQKIGALIVFERTIGLQNYINRGVRMDAILSYDLLVNIFNTNAPLHDGAVIIRNRRIAAASCFLPLTLNPRLSKELGTRHRAAIGISEESDAFVIVVSEETGVISIIEQGQITRNLDSRKLRLALSRAMDLSQVVDQPRRRYYRRTFGSEVSIAPENSSSDVPSETPASGTPILTTTSPMPSAKRFREMGGLNLGAFRFEGRSWWASIRHLADDYFFKNGKLKLIAGCLTLALWVSVTNQQDAIAYNIRGVPVVFENVSSSLIISNRDSVEFVSLRVRGPRDVIERLRPESFTIQVPMGAKGPGEAVIRIREQDGDVVIKKPDNVEILECNPPRMTVNLERVVERQVEIKPSFRGFPPTDYQVAGVTTSPSVTTLRGPESQIAALQSVGTETILLDNRRISFRDRYKIDVRDPRIEILSPATQEVDVMVNIQQASITRTFTGVPIRSTPFSESLQFSPKTVIVEVEGPKSIVENLQTENLAVTLKENDLTTPSQLSLQCLINVSIPGAAVVVKKIEPAAVQRLSRR